MSGCFEDAYVRTIQADEVLVTCRMMRILNWGQMRRVDSSTGLLCQFHESGSEIRMRVGVENRFDTGASLVGKLEIIVYIAFRIDDGSFAAMDDEIGRMGQPIDKKRSTCDSMFRMSESWECYGIIVFCH